MVLYFPVHLVINCWSAYYSWNCIYENLGGGAWKEDVFIREDLHFFLPCTSWCDSLGSLSIKFLAWGFPDHSGNVNSGCKPEMSYSYKFSVVTSFSHLRSALRLKTIIFLAVLWLRVGVKRSGRVVSSSFLLWGYSSLGYRFVVSPSLWALGFISHFLYLGSCENRSSSSSGSTNDLNS